MKILEKKKNQYNVVRIVDMIALTRSWVFVSTIRERTNQLNLCGVGDKVTKEITFWKRGINGEKN